MALGDEWEVGSERAYLAILVGIKRWRNLDHKFRLEVTHIDQLIPCIGKLLHTPAIEFDEVLRLRDILFWMFH